MATIIVPNDICSLSLEDWSNILNSLDQESRKKLLKLIEIQLKNNSNQRKQKNRKKRTLDDLNNTDDTEIDLNSNSNINKLTEPPNKKMKLDKKEESGSDKKEKELDDIESLCIELSKEAINDGIKKFVVGGLILNEKNEILVLQRAKNEFMANIYEIPSGTKDPEDKTLIDCLRREVKEESGLNMKKVLKFVNKFDYKSSSAKPTRQFNFCITVESTEKIIISDEHQAFGWIKQNQLFSKEFQDNQYIDIVAKCTPLIRDTLRKGFKVLNDIKK